MINKHQVIYDFVKQYPPLNDILYFNSVNEIPGSSGINTMFSDNIINKFIRSAVKEYVFSVVQIRIYDNSGTSNININEIYNSQQFMDWINMQDKNKNYPNFGNNCTMLSMENIENMPNLSGVSDDGTAKYVFSIRIRYFEKE